MEQKTRNHSIDSLFTFLLLLVFAFFTLMLAALGSSIYRGGIEHLNENYTSRTAIAYLSEKVRQHDSSGDIFLTDVEEIPAIGFRDTVDENTYITYVYYYGGGLRELFIAEDTAPLAEMGNQIVELESFEINALPPDEESAGKQYTGNPQLLSAVAVSQEGNELSVLIKIQSTGSLKS